MRRAIICILAIVLTASTSWAAFNVYLKNGSVLKGIEAYEEVDGNVQFRALGGTIAIPKSDIVKIEDTTVLPEAPVGTFEGVPAAPKPPEKRVDARPIKNRISRIDDRLKVIQGEEDKVNALKSEFDRVRLRIEVLFQKGRKAALKAGGKESDWFKYLVGQDREWAQLNTLKKRDLTRRIGEAESAFAPLAVEKAALTDQKQALNAELEAARGN